ncbi:hypothetical protein [Saccharolobus islandicus]|uniref:Uncharacterized protein n=1 Tax=Saccharolobus islandicus (strain L.D.8.5 / Lassen \|nr:hypothetical protein [Sulfolobus islandicus]ADB86791.1 hypothetical protein LD85_1111 [Sulfolobus islandicus L.D.8.5]
MRSELGISLGIFGTLLSLSSFFILRDNNLTALGIGIVIIGLTLISIKDEGDVSMIIEGGLANLELLLEDLDVSQKGYYFPNGNKVNVYVALNGKLSFPEPQGIITAQDGSSVLILHPPIYVIKDLNKSLDSLISEYVIERGLAEGVKVVKNGNVYALEVKNNKVYTPGRVKLVMGSCVSSIVASIIALKERKPCIVKEEKGDDKRFTALIEVLT